MTNREIGNAGSLTIQSKEKEKERDDWPYKLATKCLVSDRWQPQKRTIPF